MIEAKFTKGPWRVCTSRTVPGATEIVSANMNRAIAECWIHEDTKANAALLAVAPDMYEALRQARVYVLDNRNALADCHRNFNTGVLEPHDVCSVEDALLFQIDTVLAKTTP